MFLGLDLSLQSSGLVIIDKDYNIKHSETLSVPQKGVERLYHLKTMFKTSLDSFNIKFCCIEAPALKAEGRLFNIGELNGIIKLILYKKGINFITPAPSQLKKYATGSGKGNKSIIILDVYKNFNEEIRNDDIADAYVLARIARDYYLTDLAKCDLKKYQIEVLKALHKTNDEKLNGYIL